jgi:ribonuclease VapC
MMFVDASAIVAILTYEAEKADFELLLQDAEKILTSAISMYEATLAVKRKPDCPVEVAETSVKRFAEDTEAEIIPITAEIGKFAVAAFAKYGKTRHKADLNMGDCFAYACAKVHNAPLLCKGNDFIHTDIKIAERSP